MREDHAGRKPRSRGADLNQRIANALTDLAAYALTLDIEYQRIDKQVGELTQGQGSGADLRALLRERAALAEERVKFRGAIAAFREQVTPDGSGADPITP
jgi:alpha/beta superfamily hydrolase